MKCFQRKQSHISVILIFILTVASMASHAGVPARFYWKSLNGAKAVPFMYMSMSGNANPVDPAHTISPEASFDADIALVGYAQSFELFDRAAVAAILIPTGRISAKGKILKQDISAQVSGFGDPLLELGVNLIGSSPIRNIPDMIRYEPGFSLDVIVDLALPIGEYDDDEPLNLGQNRWYGRIGTPIVWQFGDWVPGRRNTFELLPSAWFFTDNTDFLGHTLSTEPMYQLEGHFTTDLAENFWASIDLNWLSGGQASIDGSKGEDLRNLGVGYTLGYQVNDNLQFTIGYMATINDDEPTDLKMDVFQLSVVFGWHPLVEGMKRLGH